MKKNSVQEISRDERPKHNGSVLIQTVIASIALFLLTISVMVADARSADTERLIIDLDSTLLLIQKMGSDVKSTSIWFGKLPFSGVDLTHSWEVEQYTPTQYHVRHKSWKNFFWNIDSEQKKIWLMKGVDLKSSGSDAKLLDDITVNVKQSTIIQSGVPLNANESAATSLKVSRAEDIQKDKDTIQLTSISLIMTSQLILDQQAGSMFVLVGGLAISNAEDWEILHVNKNTYHFRYKSRQQVQPSFCQINLASMTANQILGENFGFSGGNVSSESIVVYKERPNGSQAESEIPIDLGMAHYGGNHPKSAWLESEKALNAAVLSRSSYDVLVVPFQVGGYAIDRVDRSLMTRYLTREIEIATKTKLPSPTLVARALGEVSRTFDDYDIFQLANKLGVKQIIRGYVGHDLNEKMSVTLVVQTRNGQEYFSPATKTVKYSWNDIAISDERTPGEAFLSILRDVSARLQLPKTNKDDGKVIRQDPPALPAGVKGLVVNSSSSPIVRAYYLQLLGMLYPEQSSTKEQLFERSLVALRELSPQSPSYNVLKARALFYLYRRPAAVAILGPPKNAEEKTLAAVMDGNLQLLGKSMKDIKGVPRFIAEIEHSDLLWKYQARSDSLDSTIRQWPGWENILARRMNQQDGWNIQSNLEVKKALDQLLPITDFAAEDIVKSKMVLGQLPMEDDDVDFSVYNHFRRAMENQPEKLGVNESDGIVDRDVLDLMVAIGESNLFKQIKRRQMQALYDEVVKLVDRYSAVYSGRPETAYLKAFALFRIADSKQGMAQKNIIEEASLIQSNVCYWAQGQTEISFRRSCAGNNYFDTDYPRRWYWEFTNPMELTDRKYRGPKEMTQRGNLMITRFDRKELINYDLALQYTQTDFSILSAYYEKLRSIRMDDEAAILLQKNRNRFAGNSAGVSFFARIAEQDGDVKRAKAIYEEAIVLQANDWAPYQGLSSLLMKQGDYKAASETALKYPLFSISKEKQENPSVDTVMLSNHAFAVGKALWWSGATEEAKPLLRLSAGYDTGSASEMWSSMFLATLEHDFIGAAKVSLENAKRYNGNEAYGNYMEFLHVMGYHDEAWSVLNQNQGRFYSSVDWTPIIIGQRMEGKTKDEQIQWLQKLPLSEVMSQGLQLFAFRVLALDRDTDINLSTQLRAVQEQLESRKNTSQAPVSQTLQNQPKPAAQNNYTHPAVEAMRKRTGDPIPPLADGYALLKKHQYSEAYEKLKERFLGEWVNKEAFSFPVPYLAWSAAKNGNFPEIEAYLSQYKKELGDDFDYCLSMAFLAGSKKDHREAVTYLKLARYHIQSVRGVRYFPALYQLVEAAEWLYEDSKFEGYRELLVEVVKLRQIIRPMDSWAYAFEAKYTRSDADRIRALAITLYLDKRSARIAHFSESQKRNALEWLKENNPLILNQKKPQQEDI